MNEKLNRNEYHAIAEKVRSQLQKFFPKVNSQIIQSVFGPEILTKPLRISTRKTKIDFEEDEKNALAHLRKEIKREKDKNIREQNLQQLESIILFGQLLFSQSACLHFLNECNKQSNDPRITKILSQINKLLDEEGITVESSRFEVLSRRQKFDDLFSELHQQMMIKENAKELVDIPKLQENLAKAKTFYYQVNDLNFKYAQKPSRSYSKFINELQSAGSKVALTAAIISIGATALSFIPPLTPIMLPIALASSHVALFIGLPIALKNLGTMLYNFFRFGAAPTKGELIGTALLGASLVTAGLSGVANQLVTLGLISKWTAVTANGIQTATNLTKTSFAISGQVSQSLQNSEIDQVNEYRLALK